MRTIKKRFKTVEAEIAYHDDLYYNKGEPELSDAEYDDLRAKANLTKVGAKPKGALPKVKHKKPMLSLDKVNDIEGLSKLERRVLDLGYLGINFWADPKIDGLSLSLIYKNGYLEKAVTRGDGVEGELVTENAKLINTIPKTIDFGGDLEVRGEVFILKKNFEILNKRQVRSGKEEFSSPRNCAVGTLRSKDSGVMLERPLTFIAFDADILSKFNTVQFSHRLGFTTSHQAKIDMLRLLGFKAGVDGQLCNSLEEMQNYFESILDTRDSLKYDIDGVVFRVDDLEVATKLGQTAQAPKWAVAYKFPNQSKFTILRDVTHQVSRTGEIFPVAELEPVVVAQARISRATLHNYELCRNRDLRIGDRVEVARAGDVIPHIVRPIKDHRDGSEQPIQPPTNCPDCGRPTARTVREEFLRAYCRNSDCSARTKGYLEYVFSKKVFNILGLGRSQIDDLYDCGITDVISFYNLFFNDSKFWDNYSQRSRMKLAYAELLAKDGWGYGRFDNLHKQFIKVHEGVELWTVIKAVGVENVGDVLAKRLAKQLRTAERFNDVVGRSSGGRENVLYNILMEMPLMGHVSSQNIASGFTDNWQLVRSLTQFFGNYITAPTEVEVTDTDSIFNGKSVCITGVFPLSRNDMENLLASKGAEVKSGVSKKLDYLLVGQTPGSKLGKAERYGVTILRAEQLQGLL